MGLAAYALREFAHMRRVPMEARRLANKGLGAVNLGGWLTLFPGPVIPSRFDRMAVPAEAGEWGSHDTAFDVVQSQGPHIGKPTFLAAVTACTSRTERIRPVIGSETTISAVEEKADHQFLGRVEIALRGQ